MISMDRCQLAVAVLRSEESGTQAPAAGRTRESWPLSCRSRPRGASDRAATQICSSALFRFMLCLTSIRLTRPISRT
jgi:hypothetical protein